MHILATIWVILVSVSGSETPTPEFEVAGVSFRSVEDCDAAARGWNKELVSAAYTRGHRITFNGPQGRAGVTATYSCVERQRP